MDGNESGRLPGFVRVRVTLRFYEELNDFLLPSRRKKPIKRSFGHNTSLKDCIESCGVPHTEVDLILVNGESSDFDRKINDGDVISVYPVFESMDISTVTRLSGRPLRTPRFTVDVHLGRLAGKLRLLGFDTLYEKNASHSELLESLEKERRILLTRNKRILMRREVTRGLFIRGDDASEQVVQVLSRFDLFRQLNPLSRCMTCNGLLEPVAKETIVDRLEPLTKKYFNEFSICRDCGKIFWKGSHFKKLEDFIRKVGEQS